MYDTLYCQLREYNPAPCASSDPLLSPPNNPRETVGSRAAKIECKFHIPLLSDKHVFVQVALNYFSLIWMFRTQARI